MQIAKLTTQEICKLLWDANVKVEFYYGQTIAGGRKADINGNKVVSIIEPEEIFKDMVPHWSITVLEQSVRVDIGGIGRKTHNPHQALTIPMADPQCITKVVDAVKGLAHASAGYNLLNDLLDADVSPSWPYMNSGIPGGRTTQMDVRPADINHYNWAIEMRGPKIYVHVFDSHPIGWSSILEENMFEFTWNPKSRKQAVEAVKKAPYIKERPQTGSMMIQLNSDAFDKGGKNVATKDVFTTLWETNPETGEYKQHVSDEEVIAANKSAQEQMNRFHGRTKWTPDTELVDKK